jgi:hypothetical protein
MASVGQATKNVIDAINKVGGPTNIPLPPEGSKITYGEWLKVLKLYYEYLKVNKGSSNGFKDMLRKEKALMNNASLKKYVNVFLNSVKKQQDSKRQFLKGVKARSKNEKPTWMNNQAWASLGNNKSLANYVSDIYTNVSYADNKVAFFRDSDRPKVLLFVNMLDTNSTKSVYGLNLPNKLGESITSGIVDVYKTTNPASIRITLEKLTSLKPPELPVRSDDIPVNVFFAGPSGSGKTTFSDIYTKLVIDKGKGRRQIRAYNFDVGYKEGSVKSGQLVGERITFTTDTMLTLNDENAFKARFIRPTPMNPESSRTHMYADMGNGVRIYDLAGKENPIMLSMKAFGFNIFEPSLQKDNMESFDKMSGADFRKFATTFKRGSSTLLAIEKFIIAFIWNIFGPQSRLRTRTEKVRNSVSGRVKMIALSKKFEDTTQNIATLGTATPYMKGYYRAKKDIYTKYVTGSGITPPDMKDMKSGDTFTSCAQFAFDCVLRFLEGYYINYCLYELKHVFLPDMFKNHANYIEKTRNYYPDNKYVKKYKQKTNDHIFEVELGDLTPPGISPTNDIVMFYPKQLKKVEELSKFVTDVVGDSTQVRRKQILVGVVSGNKTNVNDITTQRDYFQNLKSYGMNKNNFNSYMNAKKRSVNVKATNALKKLT